MIIFNDIFAAPKKKVAMGHHIILHNILKKIVQNQYLDRITFNKNSNTLTKFLQFELNCKISRILLNQINNE
jgi:hypothetical protein